MIVITIVVTVLLMLSVTALAFRRFPNGAPPLVATCSAAMSAACHLPNDIQKHIWLYDPMRWGQCGEPQNEVGHCTLMPDDKFEKGYSKVPVVGSTLA